MIEPIFVGVDFGTTNSAVATVSEHGLPELIHYGDPLQKTLRSILFFDAEERNPDHKPRYSVGTDAIEEARDVLMEGRLVQSIKSYLANSEFSGTSIYSTRYAIADLVALILDRLRQASEKLDITWQTPIIAGRPAKFVGRDDGETETLAMTRLRDAYRFAGWGDVEFEFEPVAAAYAYATRLDKDELVLIADFGGGTSDFCILTVGPNLKHQSAEQSAIIAVDGVGIAGDAFDARIIENCVAAKLGRDLEYKSPLGKNLPVPLWIYDQLKAWHRLSFINNKKTHAILDEIIKGLEQPNSVRALKTLITKNLGFQLFLAVEHVKMALSENPKAVLHGQIGELHLNDTIVRSDFNKWIQPELRQIESCVDDLLKNNNIACADVQKVFMTGGSSLLPAVREIFERRFGADKLRGGEELTSVATGLALVARDRATIK